MFFFGSLRSNSWVLAVSHINQLFCQCIGQSTFEPHPYGKMGGSASNLDLYKAGQTGTCTIHFTVCRVKENLTLSFQHSDTGQNLGWLPSCRWVLIFAAFRTVSSLVQTCWSLQRWSAQTNFVQLWKILIGFTLLTIGRNIEELITLNNL